MQQSSDENIASILTNSEMKYRITGFVIILFALLIRLYDLGDRVFHHDESVHASFTLKLLNTGQYTYDPAYHGPFLFYSTAFVFHFLGINDTTARIIPVLFGVATIPLLFYWRKNLGKEEYSGRLSCLHFLQACYITHGFLEMILSLFSVRWPPSQEEFATLRTCTIQRDIPILSLSRLHLPLL